MSVDFAYRRYASFAAGLIFRITRSHEEIEDLVQDVFLLVARNLGGLRQPESAKAWIAVTAVNVARGALRKRRRIWRLAPNVGDRVDDLAGRGASPHDQYLIGEVRRALEALADDERTAWTLRYLQGEKLGMVAQLCGCSLSTAKRRIDVAHAYMRGAVG